MIGYVLFQIAPNMTSGYSWLWRRRWSGLCFVTTEPDDYFLAEDRPGYVRGQW